MLSEAPVDIGNGKQHMLYMGKLDLLNPVFTKYSEEVDKFRAQQRNAQAKL